MKKISFLIAAHNEEKIIGKTIKNLLGIPYSDYEIIIGLDGCTDNTKKIVESFAKKSNKIKHYNLKLRSGKPAVIDAIIKKASGEIIIINDADWIFTVKNRELLNHFLSVFDDKTVGGIAESFPVEWNEEKIAEANIGYKMVAYGTYYWILFQKRNFTYRENNAFFLKEATMFLTNIFLRSLYKKNFSLGDDFERTKNIIDMGYKIAVFNDEKIPRMIGIYDKIKIKDIFKQKIRTAIARKQLNESRVMHIGIFDYYVPAAWFIFKESWKKSRAVGLLASLWLAITASGEIISKFKKFDTKKGWTLRAER